ncbi:MAG TPA: deoxyribose-phosphate aldolase [Polyangiaceae bacterium]|nr:deoxyribose-phosphate aldolase [Polyangiaceae bacterium]
MTAADHAEIAKLIDHALLLPNLDRSALESGLALARSYEVASVCILPYYVRRAREALAGSSVLTSTTIGFPHGATSTRAKLAEAEAALDDGAEELDALVNVSQVLSGEWQSVAREVESLVTLCHQRGKKLKSIFENAYLDDGQKRTLCRICGELGVDWVKTSTGFGPSGATLPDVELMRAESPPHVQVKAAGGIRDLDTLLRFRPLVTRIGTSHTQTILDDCRRRMGLPAMRLDSSVGGGTSSAY